MSLISSSFAACLAHSVSNTSSGLSAFGYPAAPIHFWCRKSAEHSRVWEDWEDGLCNYPRSVWCFESALRRGLSSFVGSITTKSVRWKSTRKDSERVSRDWSRWHQTFSRSFAGDTFRIISVRRRLIVGCCFLVHRMTSHSRLRSVLFCLRIPVGRGHGEADGRARRGAGEPD